MISMEDPYDEWLDDIYEPVNIGGYTYLTSVALRLTDPIAYAVGRSDWEAFMEEEDEEEGA